MYTSQFKLFGVFFHSQDDKRFKNIFDFTKVGELAAKRLLVLHYSVNFIFVSFVSLDSIVELASPAQETCTLNIFSYVAYQYYFIHKMITV